MILYKNLFDLSGKVAIVTGALGILGRRFCAGLAEFGASVVVVDLDKAKVIGFAAQLQDVHHTDCMGISCDISDPDGVNAMVTTVVERFGEVHILLNNAATKSSNLTEFFAPFEDYTLEQWREVMSVNLDGMFLVAQAVGRQMIAQGRGGSIVQTSSIYGQLGPDERIYDGSSYLGRPINTPAVYTASKAGVIGLTKYLATRWGKYGIRINTLIPGGVQSGQNDTFVNLYSQRIPLGRMAQPDELIGAILYLSSNASSYVTGHSLFVDGGLQAW